MTPQDLFEETKTTLDLDIQKAQKIQNELQLKQQELNEITTKIIGNQKLLEGLKKLENVSEE